MRSTRAWGKIASSGLLALCLLLAPHAQAAEQRIALVIGNGAYANAPLANPVADATLMRDTLARDGFAVSYLPNADRHQMVRAIETLGQQLAAAGKDGVGLFYFSGHGVQADGRNYLLPVRADIASQADLLPEAVDADWVLKQMEQAGNHLDILVLDACRNSPLPVAARSDTKGLARMVAPVGSVLAFATDSGSVAYDGSGGHSPYAAALAKYMAQPGLELKAMFDAVAQAVYAQTRGEKEPQVPVQLYKLTPNFYFRPGSVPIAQLDLPVVPTPVPVAPPPVVNSLAAMTPGRVFRDCDDCMAMVRLPTGGFQMGSPSYEQGRYDNEGPLHDVSIRYPLAVGQTPVTRGQWRAFVQATGYAMSVNGCYVWDASQSKWVLQADKSWRDTGFQQDENHPAVCLAWADAKAYAEWYSRKTGRAYRLLTEAEYEYANRAGNQTAYSWGDSIDPACQYANGSDQSRIKAGEGLTNNADNLLQCDDGYTRTSPVGSFKPNAFGLYDMTGNVWEWGEDCWNESYSGAPTDGSAWTSGDCSRRVARGGSWDYLPRGLRAATRNWAAAAHANGNLGFRLARTE